LLITEIANFLKPFLPFIDKVIGWAIPYPVGYEFLLQSITVFFLVLLLLTLPKFLKIVGCNASPLFSLLILIPLSWNYIFINGLIDGAGLYYPYDIPSLTFFCIGTILFYKKKWLVFYPVFIVSLLNRESSCFISLAGFLLSSYPLSKNFRSWLQENKFLVLHILAQAILWFGSRLILSWLFRNNPGHFFETPHSMIDFLYCIKTGESHWAMQNPIWFMTIFLGTWVVPFIFYKKLNFLEKRLLVCVIIYLASLCFRSNMMEVRVYNELNVMIFIISSSFLLRSTKLLKLSIS